MCAKSLLFDIYKILIKYSAAFLNNQLSLKSLIFFSKISLGYYCFTYKVPDYSK